MTLRARLARQPALGLVGITLARYRPAASVDTLRSNLRATEVAWSDQLERRLAPLQEDSIAYWACRAQLTWN